MSALLRSGLVAFGLSFVVACGGDPEPRDQTTRIVSLAPAITHTLLAIGARDQIVGIDRYSRTMHQLADIPSLGGVFAPDLERTVELRPTLVLVVTSARQRSFRERLRERGIRVEALPELHTLNEVLGSFGVVGELVGRGREGAQLAQRVRAQLGLVAESVAGRPTPRVAMVVERDPLYVVGGGSFVNDLIKAAGGRNVFAELETPYARVSLEALADRAPEVLLDTALGPKDPAAAEALARSYWGGFPWAGRIELVSQQVVTLPGPGLAQAARLLRARIHPDAGKPEVR